MARRGKVVGTLPMSFHNLGSSQAWRIDLSREALYTRMHDRIAELAVRIPVFLVDEAQMDSITPYHLTRGMNQQGVRNRLREAIEEERAARVQSERPRTEEYPPLQRAWDDIQRDIEWAVPEGEPNPNAYWTKFTPVGLYFGRYSRMPSLQALAQQAQTPLNSNLSDLIRRTTPPVIFICPERVISWGNRLGIDPNLVFDKVLYHELGHAYMDKEYAPSDSVYQTPWGRVIEESLANWIAFSQFNKLEARYVQKLISTQPAEYQGYLVVNQLHSLPLRESDWEFYEELWDNLLRRYPLWWDWYESYHSYPLKGEWVERYDSGANFRRLRHWRRYKHARSLKVNSVLGEEQFWQRLAAQVLLEV